MIASYELRLKKTTAPNGPAARRSFHWLADQNSTIYASVLGGKHLGPSLGALGQVPDLNVDLVRIAATVFAADRSTPRERGGSDWNRRSIALTIPVLQPDSWEQHRGEFGLLLNFLTGDNWLLTFVASNSQPEQVGMRPESPDRVVLLSGGADSLIGALESRRQLAEECGSDMLVSHYAAKTLSPLQRELAEKLETVIPLEQSSHLQIRLGRSTKRLDGKRYRSEVSTRSRSLLFLALGLAVASVHSVPLWIPENGFASINPPLGMDRLGTLSTHTTHPLFLANLRALLERMGAHGDLTNPFADMTKGEMFSLAAETLGNDGASSLVSATYSCAHTGQRTFSTSEQCGVCFGCLVRRASFAASGVTDATPYIDAAGDAALQGWLDDKSAENAMAAFLERGVSNRDLIAMELPPDYRLADAIALCERGSEELRRVVQ